MMMDYANECANNFLYLEIGRLGGCVVMLEERGADGDGAGEREKGKGKG